MDGCGILIVDNSLTISGDTTFKGLIIVKGTTEIGKNPSDTTVQGNTTILGAIWTTDLLLTVGGSASVTFSTQALELANTTVPGGVVRKRATLVAWKDY
jgi:cytoskeletal protein CcmA (bactofilin family)